jgi:hypothetical protein
MIARWTRHPASWAAGDEVNGNDPRLRAELQHRRIGYVLAVAKGHPVTTQAGKHKAVDLATRLPAQVWARHSAGAGAKGQRVYDWALVEIMSANRWTGAALRLGRAPCRPGARVPEVQNSERDTYITEQGSPRWRFHRGLFWGLRIRRWCQGSATGWR